MLKIEDLGTIYDMTRTFGKKESFGDILRSKGAIDVKEYYESYMILADEEEVWVYVPENVSRLHSVCTIKHKYKNLRIIGGDNLSDLNFLFENVDVRGELDLTRLKSGNVKSIQSMFLDANINKIKLSKDWHSLERATEAFCKCKIHGELDISNIEFNHLSMIVAMFSYADIASLNIDNLKLPNITHTDGIFSNSKIHRLRINNVAIPNLVSVNSSFSWSEIDKLSLSGINAPKVRNFTYMFLGANIDSKVDLSDFNVTIKEDRDIVESMFNSCSVQELDIRNFKIDKNYILGNMFVDSNIGILYTGDDKILRKAMIEICYINKVVDVRKNK